MADGNVAPTVLAVPESAMRAIAQELGTAIINRIMLADTLKQVEAAAAAPKDAEPPADKG